MIIVIVFKFTSKIPTRGISLNSTLFMLASTVSATIPQKSEVGGLFIGQQAISISLTDFIPIISLWPCKLFSTHVISGK